MSCTGDPLILTIVFVLSVAITVIVLTFFHLTLPLKKGHDTENISADWPPDFYDNKYGKHPQAVYTDDALYAMAMEARAIKNGQCNINSPTESDGANIFNRSQSLYTCCSTRPPQH